MNMSMSMNTKKQKPFHVVINDGIDPRVPFVQIVRGKRKPSSPYIAIDKARLDTSNFMLIVNDNERRISFSSKKAGSGLSKETKEFKALVLLWEFRSEVKNKKPIKIKNVLSDYTTFKNLKIATESPTENAARQIVKRLRGIFRKNGLPIDIEEEKGKCRLIIKKGVV